MIVFGYPQYAVKFSCKSTPKFTHARPRAAGGGAGRPTHGVAIASTRERACVARCIRNLPELYRIKNAYFYLIFMAGVRVPLVLLPLPLLVSLSLSLLLSLPLFISLLTLTA